MVYRTTKQVQERKDANRKHIFETAAVVFARQGYHGTTVKNIVDEAGTSVGSFYFYFKNKEDLLEALYDEITGMILSVTEVNTRCDAVGAMKTVCRGVASTLSIFQQRRDLARIMMIEVVGLNPRFEQKRAESINKLLLRIGQNLEAFQENGLIAIPDVKTAAMAFEGTIYHTVISWLYEENPGNLQDSIHPLAIYNLQALGIAFSEAEVKDYLNEISSQYFGFEQG